MEELRALEDIVLHRYANGWKLQIWWRGLSIHTSEIKLWHFEVSHIIMFVWGSYVHVFRPHATWTTGNTRHAREHIRLMMHSWKCQSADCGSNSWSLSRDVLSSTRCRWEPIWPSYVTKSPIESTHPSSGRSSWVSSLIFKEHINYSIFWFHCHYFQILVGYVYQYKFNEITKKNWFKSRQTSYWTHHDWEGLPWNWT